MRIPQPVTRTVEKLRVNSAVWISDQAVDQWVSDTQFSFVLAIGRSGTAFLAHLLGKIDGTVVEHEPVILDYEAHQSAFHSPQQALLYLERFRKKEIYLRIHRRNIKYYGEVNSLLRRHAGVLPQVFPGVNLVHLVRDGRDVVRSMMNRKTFTPQDSHTRRIYPLENDPWKAEWENMDRFARLCWYWQVENAYLLKHIDHFVLFEKLVSDYEYFDRELLQPLELKLSKTVWAENVQSPQNISRNYKMPKWEEWSPEQKTTFKLICGEEMTACGYEI